MQKDTDIFETASEIIKGAGKSYISLDEIEAGLNSRRPGAGFVEYGQLVDAVKKLIQAGAVKPAGRPNLTNGKIPPLRLKYRIIKESNDFSEYLDEIKQLHPAFNISGYVKNPDNYVKSRQIILELNRFLKDGATSLSEPMSKNERAYEIWGNEKALDDPQVNSVVEYSNIREKLNYYMTPEPFFDYINSYGDVMNILIVENKDTWFTLRKLLTASPERCTMFGEKIDGLLYGEGKKITAPGALKTYECDVIARPCRFLYFGDLDFTGIAIFLAVRKVNPGVGIHLFKELYEEMLTKARQRPGYMQGYTRKKQAVKTEISEFLHNFQETSRTEIMNMLAEHRYIPQEILNYQVLKRLLI